MTRRDEIVAAAARLASASSDKTTERMSALQSLCWRPRLGIHSPSVATALRWLAEDIAIGRTEEPSHWHEWKDMTD